MDPLWNRGTENPGRQDLNTRNERFAGGMRRTLPGNVNSGGLSIPEEKLLHCGTTLSKHKPTRIDVKHITGCRRSAGMHRKRHCLDSGQILCERERRSSPVATPFLAARAPVHEFDASRWLRGDVHGW
jgi:hypothetical protein